jgi:hypothetical protein
LRLFEKEWKPILNFIIACFSGLWIGFVLVRQAQATVCAKPLQIFSRLWLRTLLVLPIVMAGLALFEKFSRFIFKPVIYLGIGSGVALIGLIIMGFFRANGRRKKFNPGWINSSKYVFHNPQEIAWLHSISAITAFIFAMLALAALNRVSTVQLFTLVGSMLLTMILTSICLVWLANHFASRPLYFIKFYKLVEIESGLFLIISGMLIMSGKISGLSGAIDHFFSGR